MSKIKQNMLCLIAAFFSLWAVTSMLKIDAGRYPVSNSIFSIVLFIGLFWLMRTAFLRLNKRLAAVSGVFGFIFSAFMICGANILERAHAFLNKPLTWLRILAGVPLFMALLVMVLVTVSRWNQAVSVPKLEKLTDHFSGRKKVFFICWLLIFLAWLPGLIATYPGIYAYDGVFQVRYYQTGVIDLHHPLIHTYLIGFCVVTLGNLLGSPEAGYLVYALFQMLCLSAAFAIICSYMARKKMAVLLRLGFLLLFMFFPPNVLMAIASTKDVLFSALFAVMIFLLIYMADKPEVLKNNWFCVLFIAMAFFFMAFRSQGIYVFVFGMLFCFVLLRKQWKRLLAVFSICLVLFAVYSGPITTLCKGQKFDSLREMMSVPCVQLSRMMLYAPEQLTTEEKALIEAYIPEYQAYSYNAAISDIMKRSFNTDRFRDDPTEFINLWARVGLRCPTVYIDAFLRITIGLWYPDMNYRDPQAAHPYWEYNTQHHLDDSYIIVENTTPAGMTWLFNFYNKLTHQSLYQKIPVVSMLFSSGFMVWLLFLYIAWCLYEKKYRHLVPASFIFGLWLTLLLGPVVLYRYVYPIAMAVPLLICSALTGKKAPEAEKEVSGAQ